MGLRLDHDTLRKVLAMATPTTLAAIESEPKATKLVTPGIAIEPNRVIIMVAVQTMNETNQRVWRAKNRRAGAAWRSVRESIGVHLGALEPFARVYASGGALRVCMTRLGGRKLDLSNIPPATKGVEDAIAYLLGCDYGDSRWHPSWGQEPGGEVGVRVEIEMM